MTDGLLKSAKGKVLWRAVLTLLLVILAMPLNWVAFGDICNSIGSAVCGTPMRGLQQMIRRLPAVAVALSVSILTVSAIFSDGSDKHLIRKRAALASSICGTLAFVWVIFGYAFGEYPKLIEGFPTKFFSLDFLIGGAILAVFCFLLFRASDREDEALTKKRSGVFKAFGGLAVLCGVFGLTAVFVGISTIDFSHGGIFFSIVLLLCYLDAALLTLAYTVVKRVEDPALKIYLQKKVSLGFLLCGILLFALYFAAVGLQNEAPNLNTFAILPVDFTASVHAFPLIYIPVNLLSPLIAFLRSRKTQVG